MSKDMSTEALEKRGSYGFLRCVKMLRSGAKISIGFREDEVRGRTEEQLFFIAEKFLQKTKKAKITIAENIFEMNIPDYADYMILKIMSARPSDTRDIATLVWKNSIPSNLKDEADETLVKSEILDENLKLMISDISDKRFLNSWKGTFITTEFIEETKEKY
jgi:hypothetical protein